MIEKGNRAPNDNMPTQSSTKMTTTTASTGFPIAGIGGSAGALEVFKELLSSIPSDTGMAFIIIQHLDPKHESMTSEILARETKMPVREAEEGMQVEPNSVYVIPPNCNLDLTHGDITHPATYRSSRAALASRFFS